MENSLYLPAEDSIMLAKEAAKSGRHLFLGCKEIL